MAFIRASRVATKLRLALSGPAGAGKTRTALEISRHLVTSGQRIAVVDTEQGSASKYADVGGLDFDVMEIKGNYHPKQIAGAIQEAANGGYGVIIFDSMTHFWNGVGGFLQLVDEEAKRAAARAGKSFLDGHSAWKAIDPIYRNMVQDLLNSPIHVIGTMRAKTEYERTEGANGKQKIQKVGMAPQMRDDFQYEFDVEGTLDMDHCLMIGKTRIDEFDGKVFKKAGKDFADIYHQWAASGAPMRSPAPLSAPASVDRDEAEALFLRYNNFITNASSPESLRAFLPEMKADYSKMTEADVTTLRAAYTERSNALKNGAASAAE